MRKSGCESQWGWISFTGHAMTDKAVRHVSQRNKRIERAGGETRLASRVIDSPPRLNNRDSQGSSSWGAVCAKIPENRPESDIRMGHFPLPLSSTGSLFPSIPLSFRLESTAAGVPRKFTNSIHHDGCDPLTS